MTDQRYSFGGRDAESVRGAEHDVFSSGTSAMASLDLLYQSDDDRFALFEIFDGHLAAVDTSKLA